MENDSQTLEAMSQASGYNSWLLGKFLKFIKGEILEVGCGIGNFSKLISQYGKLTAMDINEDYIGRVKSNLNGTVSVGVGDIEKGKFFFGNRKFDSIVCINVLEHIKDDNSALLNLNKLLRKDGFLILLVPSHQFLYGKIDEAIYHFRRYQKENLSKQLTSRGFRVISARRLNFLGAIGWWISGKLLGNTRVDKGKLKIFNIFSPPFLLIENFHELPLGLSILVIAQKN